MTSLCHITKGNFYQNILQKLRSENYSQVLSCLQIIRHNFCWEMKFLKQATYIRYVIAKRHGVKVGPGPPDPGPPSKFISLLFDLLCSRQIHIYIYIHIYTYTYICNHENNEILYICMYENLYIYIMKTYIYIHIYVYIIYTYIYI